MKNDTPLLVLAIVLGCAVVGVAVKLAFWPQRNRRPEVRQTEVRQPKPGPTVESIRLEDYTLSNYDGLDPAILVTPGTHELELKRDPALDSTSGPVQSRSR